MKVWRWHCTTHELITLVMQTGEEPPVYCSGIVDLVYPDSGPCVFHGYPVYEVYQEVAHV